MRGPSGGTLKGYLGNHRLFIGRVIGGGIPAGAADDGIRTRHLHIGGADVGKAAGVLLGIVGKGQRPVKGAIIGIHGGIQQNFRAAGFVAQGDQRPCALVEILSFAVQLLEAVAAQAYVAFPVIKKGGREGGQILQVAQVSVQLRGDLFFAAASGQSRRHQDAGQG